MGGLCRASRCDSQVTGAAHQHIKLTKIRKLLPRQNVFVSYATLHDFAVCMTTILRVILRSGVAGIARYILAGTRLAPPPSRRL